MTANVATMTPDNRDDLRYAARIAPDGTGAGFLFMVNSQDHDTLRHDQTGLTVTVNMPGQSLTVGGKDGFTLPANTSAILPFNFDMDGALLNYATAQPLTMIDDGGTPHYFFVVPDGMAPEYSFDKATVRGKSEFGNIVPGYKSTFTVKNRQGRRVKITTLPFGEAENIVKVGNRLLITDAGVAVDGDSATLYQPGNPVFEYVLYPSVSGFRPNTISVPEAPAEGMVVDKSVPGRMEICFNPSTERLPQVNEYFLRVPYTGDVAMAFLDNRMILDHFWQGRPWTIALGRYADVMGAGKPLGFYFRPLRQDAPFLKHIEPWLIPDLSQGPVLEIGEPEVIPEYTTSISLQ